MNIGPAIGFYQFTPVVGAGKYALTASNASILALPLAVQEAALGVIYKSRGAGSTWEGRAATTIDNLYVQCGDGIYAYVYLILPDVGPRFRPSQQHTQLATRLVNPSSQYIRGVGASMWTEYQGKPVYGLGAVPVHHPDKGLWLAKRAGDGKIMAYAPPRPGLGALSNPATITAATNLIAALQAQPDQSGCASNAAVSAFQTAYNADPGATSQLTVDGLYGQNTNSALVSTGMAVPAVTLCSSGSGGGGTTTATGGTVVVNPSSTDYTPYLIGAGVVAAGGLGWYLWKHGRKRR